MQHLLGVPVRWLRHTARLLLLAMSVATLGPLVHGVHVEDCDPVFVVHDESQHHVQAARPDSGGGYDADHCVACHFARSSRGPASWEPSGLTSLDSGVLLYHADGDLMAAPSASPLPARAPPRA